MVTRQTSVKTSLSSAQILGVTKLPIYKERLRRACHFSSEISPSGVSSVILISFF